MKKVRITYDSLKESLLARIIKNSKGCWLWNGPRWTPAHKFGSLFFRGKNHLPHEASFQIFKGEITPWLLVLQSCKNTDCVNPDHLYLGRDYSLERLPRRIYKDKETIFQYYVPKEQLNEAECWEWQGDRFHNDGIKNYGKLQFKKTCTGAHRFSYELHYGQIPEGLIICHKCDNPPCVNPHHLFAGTYSDNMFDASKKGRLFVGKYENGSNAKLLNSDVKHIRKLHTEGMSPKEIAEYYPIVSYAHIWRVATNKSWIGLQ